MNEFIHLFLVWLAAIVEHWEAAVTIGAIPFAIHLLDKFAGWDMPKRLYAIFATLALVAAMFLAWKDEHVGRLNAEAEKNPVLDAQILQVTTGYEVNGQYPLFIWADIRNSGADSTVYQYRLRLADGTQIFPSLIADSTVMKVKDKPLVVLNRRDNLYEVTRPPLKKGEVRSGVILFFLTEDQYRRATSDEKLWLVFADYLNKFYSFEAFYGKVEGDPARLLGLPGVGETPKQP